jgi:hypothetical protein
MKKLLLALAAAAALFAGPAFAVNCSGYSYTLTNGTTANATQVMANFNSILSCANNNLAHNAANSDITSLSGLTTPLSAAQGGTGQATSIFSSNNSWTGTQAFSNGLTLATGTTSLTPLTIPAGVLNTTPVSGALEYDGALYYGSIASGPTRKTFAYIDSAITGSAAKWTTARTITLGGLLSGSVSIDGSASVTLTAGTTLASAVTTVTSGTSAAPINVPPGAAPSAPVNGDLWTTSTGVYGRVNGTTTVLSAQLIEVGNQRALGVASGESFGSGGIPFAARILNTTVFNNISGASLSANRVTLPAGTYRVTVHSPMQNMTSGQSAIYNVTDASYAAYGVIASNPTGDSLNADVSSVFTISGTKVMELRIGGAGAGGAAPGSPQSLGTEVYSDLIFEKIG